MIVVKTLEICLDIIYVLGLLVKNASVYLQIFAVPPLNVWNLAERSILKAKVAALKSLKPKCYDFLSPSQLCSILPKQTAELAISVKHLEDD